MLDFEKLDTYMDYLASSVLLSPEQRTVIQSSLVILKHQMKFSHLCFWGRIHGSQADYYIVQGVEGIDWYNRRTLFSQDCLEWALLNPATEEMRTKAKTVADLHFTGDLTYETAPYRPVTEEEEADVAEEEDEKIKEEDRLIATIAEIDEQTSLVPRGAFVLDPTGHVNINRTFEGLSESDACKLVNYLHMHPPTHLFKKTLLQRANLDRAIDFLDPATEDVPGAPDLCWSLQHERGGSHVVIRSLLWPGYTFFHIPESRHFGSLYDGCGIYNIDLPFMI